VYSGFHSEIQQKVVVSRAAQCIYLLIRNVTLISGENRQTSPVIMHEKLCRKYIGFDSTRPHTVLYFYVTTEKLFHQTTWNSVLLRFKNVTRINLGIS